MDLDPEAVGLRYALYVPNFGAFGSAQALADLAVDAERAGWDGFFIWDHIDRAFATDVTDPQVALAAIAVRTRRLRIGALVTPLARRRPWKVARETVALDRLSGGRLVFGAGLGSRGGAAPEWANLGEETDLRCRAQMLDEGLAILDGLWSGRPFSFSGRHYHVREAAFTPAALQTPRIPVWIAGYWPPARGGPFARAARWDGVFPLLRPDVTDPVAAIAAGVEAVRSRRAPDAQLDVVHLAPPGGAGQTDFAAAGVTWWLERLTPDEFGAAWGGDWPAEAMRAHVRNGPPRPPGLPRLPEKGARADA